MKEILFHGSEQMIEVPEYGKGKLKNDYGRGFYCTREIDLAREWSVEKDRDGYVNQYTIDIDGLKILNLCEGKYNTFHWLGVLLQNRTFDLDSPLEREAKRYILEQFPVDYEDIDIMIGYRADDSYFSFAQSFLSGTISYRQLSEAMHLGKLGLQVVLKSEQAFNRIEYVNSEPVLAGEWFAKKQRRDQLARKKYYNMNKEIWQKGELYMIQILEGDVKDGDPRLR